MDTLPEAWAQLVSTHESESDPTEIKKNKFIIGRSTGTEVVHLDRAPGSGTVSHRYVLLRELFSYTEHTGP